MQALIKKIFMALLSLSLSFAFIHQALASNGLRSISTGPVSLGMGGTGVAMPQTSNALLINPAGMTDIDSSIDLSFTVAFPSSFMGSSLAPAGNANAVRVEGTEDAVFIPSGSSVLKIKDTKLSIGTGAIPSAGFQVEFPNSRFSSAVTGDLYDRSGKYGNIKIPVGFAYKVLDNLSVGASLDINYAFFNTDSAT
ncbi:MAG: outer membrane protein transport protein, partial [Deltaproteobacteria bacterium]|nr:outer membrane protein transport protein [Deltaproteobacteria bacterium]